KHNRRAGPVVPFVPIPAGGILPSEDRIPGTWHVWIPKAHNRLARQVAAAIYAAFGDYEREFQAITRRAKVRFEQRDWHGLQHDALERLDLYPRVIARGVATIRKLLDFSEKDKKLWATMKPAYAELIGSCQDIELAETFFNSVSRRIFTTIGVDPRIEFLFSDFDSPAEASNPRTKSRATPGRSMPSTWFRRSSTATRALTWWVGSGAAIRSCHCPWRCTTWPAASSSMRSCCRPTR